jgi:SOS response regulatory protein OraA/RecX
MASARRQSPRIEALRPLAADPNAVEVRVRGTTVATLPRVRAEELRIREGAAWTPALAARASRAAAAALAREAALGLLARQGRSAAGLRQRLERAGHSAEAAREAVRSLVEDGWIDDRAFAAARTEQHRRKGPLPAEALEELLRRDGIEARDAQDAAEHGAATDAELRSVARAARAEGQPASRVAARLARRGFNPDTIREVLERAGYDLDA